MSEKKVAGYCLKCKRTREMTKVQSVIMKNKRHAFKGICKECGTKMFKIKKKGE